ncbi:cell envelope-related Asp23 family protein [Labedella gwakjiensis]|uniref:Asp23/Gls24 family envelope stress response protein n=1 Tax=Labedella gwakjiensis TaxID=390269 RepID=A0A2P8GTX3_9MICO|nr:Asp23/Gls24 family envelope stress response protein [Labedella gwakjiensis]PSL37411.1 cell envelope-related Asp23 family protein [Labedella gwakjiensis]RUQ84729.1 Asp23/Gls24 family envelope stress response protein [Labedella gwakjiensis]
MTDDAKTDDGAHIPTPAEVHHDHPTVLVPVPPDEDTVRRIESHDEGTPSSAGSSDSAPVAESSVTHPPVANAPAVDLETSPTRRSESDELAQLIGDAASAVAGVYALGSRSARAVDSARLSLLGRTSVPGVNVLVDRDVLNVEVSLVAEYPANVSAVADAVRADLTTRLAGRHDGPLDIDVTVTDVHGPFDSEEPDPGQAIDAIKARAGETKDRAAASVGDAKARAGAAIDDAKERAGEALDGAKVRAGQAIDDAKADAASAADATADAIQNARTVADRAIDDAKADAAAAADDAADATDDVRNDTADAIDDIADDIDEARADEARGDAASADEAAASAPTDGTSDDLANAAERLAEAADALADAADSTARPATDDRPGADQR